MMTSKDDIRVEIRTAADLVAGDADAWRAMQEAEEKFSNPLFGPDFFQAVGRVRNDAKVAIFRCGTVAAGFGPCHARRRTGSAESGCRN